MTPNDFDIDAPVATAVRCSNCGGPQKRAGASACQYCGVALGPVRDGVAGAPWTLFWDMHSGGGTKLAPFEKIYIQAPEAPAKVIFYNRFGRNPERITCTCCGEDYSIVESATLAEASGYHRNLRYVRRVLATGAPRVYDGRYLEPGEAMPEGFTTESVGQARRRDGLTLREYMQQPNVKIIPDSEILPTERAGKVPREGWVRADDGEEEST